LHAVGHRAELQPAPAEVRFGVLEEAVGVGGMPGMQAQEAQVLDRVLTRQLQHLVLDKQLSLLTELVAQMAEHRGRLVTDLASSQSLGHLWQRLQLLADAEAGRPQRWMTSCSCGAARRPHSERPRPGARRGAGTLASGGR